MPQNFGLPNLPSLPGLGGSGPTSDLRRPLGADEKQSYGKQLLSAGGSALNYMLGSANKPGRAVRGLLGGKPQEALAAIPFSDTLGISNPDNEVTGRNLMDRYGVTQKGDKGWGAWGLGLGADIATDPLTYWTGGAKHAFTGGGKALSKAGELAGWNRKALLEGYHGTESAMAARGVTADRIAHLRDKGQRIASPAAETAYAAATGKALQPGQALSGLGRWHVPFRSDLGATVGKGGLAQFVAGKLDKAADFAQFGNPVGRSLGGLFDYSRNRGLGEHMQRGWSGAGKTTLARLEAAARVAERRSARDVDAMMAAHPGYEVPAMRAYRISAESASPRALLNSAKNPAELLKYQQILREAQPHGSMVQKAHAGWLSEGQASGLSVADANDQYVSNIHRRSTSSERAGTGPQFTAPKATGTISPTSSGSNIQRDEWTRNVPGGTDRLNDLVSRHAGAASTDALHRSIFGDLMGDHPLAGGGAVPSKDVLDLMEKSKLIGNAVENLDPTKYLGKLDTHPFFSHNMTAAVAERGQQHARTMASASALISGLAGAAKGVNDFAPGESVTNLRQALNQLGLSTRNDGALTTGAGPRMLKAMAPKGAGPVDSLVHSPHTVPLDAELRQWGVGAQDWADISRSHNRWQMPDEVKPFVGPLDSITNSFKALTYPIWLASHVRNATTAALNNMRTGTRLQDYIKQFRLMTGKLPQHEAEAAIERQFGHSKIFQEGGPNLELAGPAGSAMAPGARQWSTYAPGTNEYGIGARGPTGSVLGDTVNLLGNRGVGDLFRGIGKKVMSPRSAPNPFQLSGVYKPTATVAEQAVRHPDIFAPVVAGRTLSTNVENFFRGAQEQGLHRQGYSPGEIGKQIERFHFDYSHLTPFEKNVMRRVAPFYTYSRKNLPLQLETIATRPAAFTTPMKPATVNRDQKPYVPAYLGGGFAMPISPEVNGTQRFLSSLGLPQEEALKDFKTMSGAPDIRGTAMGLAGHLNPLVKGPLEWLTDRQFFTGRQLSDLRPSAAGRTLAAPFSDDTASWMTQLISNTPLTRFATGLDKLLDTQGVSATGRKPPWATAVNLGTGARVTDVNIPQQKYFEQRNANNRMLAGSPNISKYNEFYARPESRGLLTPDEILRLRMQAALQEQGRAAKQAALRGGQ